MLSYAPIFCFFKSLSFAFLLNSTNSVNKSLWSWSPTFKLILPANIFYHCCKLLKIIYIFSWFIYEIFRLYHFSISWTLLISFWTSAFRWPSEIASLIVNCCPPGFTYFKDSACFHSWSKIVFLCFKNVFPRRE